MKLPAVLCLLLICSASAQDKSPAVLSAGGRFVFGQISHMARDQFMLDTQTGRLWQLVVSPDGSPQLAPVPYASLMRNLYLVPPTEQQESADYDAALLKLSTARTNSATPWNDFIRSHTNGTARFDFLAATNRPAITPLKLEPVDPKKP